MAKIDCSMCKNKSHASDCKCGFRMAANAGGAAVDCTEDVWFCADYDEHEDEGGCGDIE